MLLCVCVCVFVSGAKRGALAVDEVAGEKLRCGVSCRQGQPDGHALLVSFEGVFAPLPCTSWKLSCLLYIYAPANCSTVFRWLIIIWTLNLRQIFNDNEHFFKIELQKKKKVKILLLWFLNVS